MKKLLYLFGFIFPLLFEACLEPVDLVLPQAKAKLVVVSNFTNSMAFEVIVTESAQNGEANNENVFVKNAKVTISNNGNVLESLKYMPANHQSTLPKYVSETLRADIGVVYEIHVSAPGFEPVTSIGFIPEPTKINSSSANQINSGSQKVENRIWVSLEISDPGGISNYYHLNIFQRSISNEQTENGPVETEKLIGPLKMFNVDENLPVIGYIDNRGVFLKDEFFDGKKRKFFFEVELDQVFSSENANDLILELRTVSKEYYLYYLTLKRQADRNTEPFSDPTVNFTNIENGLGIFAGFSATIDTIDINR